MLTFALAVARPGHRLPASVVALLEDPRLAEVPFAPRRHLAWSDPTRAVLFGGWQNLDEAADPMRSRWEGDADGLTAFTGHARPRDGRWADTRSAAAGLARHLSVHPLDAGTETLAGPFVAVSLRSDGSGTLGVDPLGLGLIYHAEDEQLTVLASRASLAARILAASQRLERPARDPLGACWLAYAVHPMGDRTGYRDVTVVPPDAIVEVDPDTGARIRRSHRRFWRFPTPLETDPHALAGEVRDDTAQSLRWTLDLPIEHRVVDITGGKDTRLVLAVILAAGLADRFEYRTLGRPDLPDVQVASRIAESFALPLQLDPPTSGGRGARVERNRMLESAGFSTPPERETFMRLAVSSHLGMRNVFAPQMTFAPRGDVINLCGITGELLRTYFVGAADVPSLDALEGFFFEGVRFGGAGIFRPEVRAHFDRELWGLLFEAFEAQDRPEDVLDAFFLRHRLRRWYGTWREVDELDRFAVLYTLVGVRAAFEMGAADRHDEYLHREIIRGASPVLADLPLADSHWKTPSSRSRLVRAVRSRFRRRGGPPALRPDRIVPSPFRAADSPQGRRTVRSDRLEAEQGTDVETMRRYLLDRTNPIQDLLDRPRVVEALDGFSQLTESSARQMYGALSAAIWLGGAEIAYPAAVP